MYRGTAKNEGRLINPRTHGSPYWSDRETEVYFAVVKVK